VWEKINPLSILDPLLDRVYHFSSGMLKGAFLYSTVQHLWTLKSIVSIPLNAYLKPASYHTWDPGSLVGELFRYIKINKSLLSLKKVTVVNAGGNINGVFGRGIPMHADKFIPASIYLAKCPKVEFARQYYDIFNREYQIPTLFERVANAYQVAGREEFYAREFMQSFALKLMIHRVFDVFLPERADLKKAVLQSKICALFRIVIAMALYSQIFSPSKIRFEEFYTDDTLDLSFTGHLVSGIAFGILREQYGFGAAFGAHLVRDVVAFLPAYYDNC
jgi:hypothetical protein